MSSSVHMLSIMGAVLSSVTVISFITAAVAASSLFRHGEPLSDRRKAVRDLGFMLSVATFIIATYVMIFVVTLPRNS